MELQNPPDAERVASTSACTSSKSTPKHHYDIPVGSPYYFDPAHNLRKVHPYNHTYLTYAKQRWIGRELLEIFTTEFRDRSQEFYDWAISTGTVMVNGKVVNGSYVLKNGDLISNVIHRHEPPILGGRIEIYHKDLDKGIWIVEKKGSMPIHATGRYRENTLLQVLKNEEGLENVSTANRLDRLVSGIMLIGTNKAAAQELGKAFQTPGRVKKEYVARVTGKFPGRSVDGEESTLRCGSSQTSSDEAEAQQDSETEDVVCEEPILTIDKQIGVNVVHPNGRPCKTIFRRISYDARTDTSVVRCRPITGRSHQLRVHLQFLGHPIANDPIYNNVLAWGKKGGKGGLFRDVKPRIPVAASNGTEVKDVTPLPEDGESYLQDGHSAHNLAGKLNDMLASESPLAIAKRKKEKKGLARVQAEAAEAAGTLDSNGIMKHEQRPRGTGKGGMSPSHAAILAQTQKLQLSPSGSPTRTSGNQTPLLQPGEAVDDTLGTGTETTLNPEAISAILELRKVRDLEDNFARFRDMDRRPPPMPLPIDGVGSDNSEGQSKGPISTEDVTMTTKHAQPGSPVHGDTPRTGLSAKKGIRMLSRSERDSLANSYQQHEKILQDQKRARGEGDVDIQQEDPEWYVASDESGEYCRVCGVPLLPDPKPEHLLIWLHAIRYHTDEWDYSSPLPEWARPDWTGTAPTAEVFYSSTSKADGQQAENASK